MVSPKTFALAAIVLAHEAHAISILYIIKYYGAQGQGRRREVNGRDVTDAQANRIKSNMYLWSQGNFRAYDSAGRLIVTNERIVANYDASDTVRVNMVAAINYHVFGGGASH